MLIFFSAGFPLFPPLSSIVPFFGLSPLPPLLPPFVFSPPPLSLSTDDDRLGPGRQSLVVFFNYGVHVQPFFEGFPFLLSASLSSFRLFEARFQKEGRGLLFPQQIPSPRVASLEKAPPFQLRTRPFLVGPPSSSIFPHNFHCTPHCLFSIRLHFPRTLLSRPPFPPLSEKIILLPPFIQRPFCSFSLAAVAPVGFSLYVQVSFSSFRGRTSTRPFLSPCCNSKLSYRSFWCTWVLTPFPSFYWSPSPFPPRQLILLLSPQSL